uniref:Protein kinase domain-containing protein n=1 Tax=Ananas comosus var. bracteatus TaxID=296719 RepID=A0A6V7NY58_ANACO|nr:unnamed protein product [Ananas comosus var. bracteatus]
MLRSDDASSAANCSSSSTCGGVSISYPFWRSDGPPSFSAVHCGYPGFGIACELEDKQQPILQIGSVHYYKVTNIDYTGRTINLTDMDVVLATPDTIGCPRSLHNFTFSSDVASSLNYTGADANLTFFFGCSVGDPSPWNDFLQQNVIPCVGYGDKSSFVFPSNGIPPEIRGVPCEDVVVAPVLLHFLATYDFIEALNHGFQLAWIAGAPEGAMNASAPAGSAASTRLAASAPTRRQTAIALPMMLLLPPIALLPPPAAAPASPIRSGAPTVLRLSPPSTAATPDSGSPAKKTSSSLSSRSVPATTTRSPISITTAAPSTSPTLTNIASSLDYTSADANLTFFFNCSVDDPSLRNDLLKQYVIPCLGYGDKSSLAFPSNGVPPEIWGVTCEDVVVAPVLLDILATYDFIEALNHGFQLAWMAGAPKGCGECESSGRRCGFNQTSGSPLCFCPDGTRAGGDCPETLPLLPFVLLLLLACILPSLSDAKNYYRYTDCAPTNYTCGTMKFTVGYPFQFGTARPDYCRYPGYYLTCTDDTLLINIDEKMMPFQVKNIDYGNHLLTLVDLNFSAETCPLPNYSVTINTTIFDYNERSTMMTIYNCSSPQISLPADIYKFPCADEMSGQYYYYRLNDGDSVFGNCDLASQVLVQISAAYLFSHGNLSFEDVMNEGFMLRWTAGKGWCSDCVSSGGNCGYNTVARDQQTCYCPNGTAIRNCTTGSSVGAAAGLVGLCSLCVFLYIRTRRRRHSPSSSNLIRNASSSVPNSYSKSKDPELGGGSSVFYQTHLFSYDELEAATDGFSDSRELGDGGFGTVYKGILRDGRVVAIKRLYENNWRRVEQFKNEVAILSLIRHPNLVALYGCTSRHSRELLLVYEYISNGTIADHLHGSRADERALTWPRRLSIAIETADALAYLHAVNPPIIHRDVKTNNILLDADFHVKVADFGLSRLFPLDATHVTPAQPPPSDKKVIKEEERWTLKSAPTKKCTNKGRNNGRDDIITQKLSSKGTYRKWRKRIRGWEKKRVVTLTREEEHWRREKGRARREAKNNQPKHSSYIFVSPFLFKTKVQLVPNILISKQKSK